MSKASIFLPALLILVCPVIGHADTVALIESDATLQPVPAAAVPDPRDPFSLVNHHKNAHVYLPLWDTRTLKMSVPWDAGYDMPSKPKTLSLMGTTGDVYWQSHLRPEPANLGSARLATVSLPASVAFMLFALLSLWMAAASRQTKAVRRRYN